jgi:hypothetical protein
MSDEQLQEIEARANAARQGPWGQIVMTQQWYPELESYGMPNLALLCFPESYELTEADQEFIAAAREDVPALVAEVRRLKAELGRPFDADAYSLPVSTGEAETLKVKLVGGGRAKPLPVDDPFLD